MLNKKNFFDRLFVVFFILSSPFFTVLVSNRYEPKVVLIGALLSLIIVFFLSCRYLKKVLLNYRILFVSFLLSLYSVKYYIVYDNLSLFFIKNKFNNMFNIYLDSFFDNIFALISSVFLSGLIYLFIEKIFPRITKFFKELSLIEKKYLVIVFLIGFLSSVVLSHLTSAFSIPYYDGKLQIYDVIYTSDSGAITYEDAFFNVSYVENDIRQPLFGVFAFPFSLVGKIISEFMFFVPSGYEYATSMTIIQFILLSIITIFVSRMLKLSECEKKLFFVLTSVCFSYLLFSILLEQYVIGIFYLILACYYRFNSRKTNYLFVASVGTMLTSGITFFMIPKNFKIKTIIFDLLKCFLLFCFVLVIWGQFPQIFLAFKNFNSLTSSFAHKLSFVEKFYQFSNFVSGIFITPKSYITYLFEHPSYQLYPVSKIILSGVVIFVICVVSYILNRKNNFIKFCLFWILFSFILLCIFGWGTSENGLILYSIYFAFAYISLLFMLIKKMFNNAKFLNYFIYICSCVLFIINCFGLYDLLKFSIMYY